jgi:hypothetical protein
MEEISGNQVVLYEQKTFPFDVIELWCNLPTLINIYYTDSENIKTTNLEIGDISILTLHVKEQIPLAFKPEKYSPFIYGFTVETQYYTNMSIAFDDVDEMQIDKDGFYVKSSLTQYNNITLTNNINSGYSFIRVIFKFGLAIESYFTKDEKGIYSNERDENREYNLYGYIYEVPQNIIIQA